MQVRYGDFDELYEKQFSPQIVEGWKELKDEEFGIKSFNDLALGIAEGR